MAVFRGGPMDGTAVFDPAVDERGPAPEQGGGDEDEAAKLDRMLQDALGLAQGGTLSEQDKLKIQKVLTIIQEIKAAEEKEMDGAMKGAMTPGLLRKANAGTAGAAGY